MTGAPREPAPLSAGQVNFMRHFGTNPANPAYDETWAEITDSHELLRAKLAEAERERDLATKAGEVFASAGLSYFRERDAALRVVEAVKIALDNNRPAYEALTDWNNIRIALAAVDPEWGRAERMRDEKYRSE